MIRKRQLLINAVASGLQVVVTAGTLFVLYRFVKDSIGIENFGIWSLVLATTSVSSLANLGMAASVVKFVSMYLARGCPDRASAIVQTGVITLAVVLAIALVMLYPVVARILEEPLESDQVPLALSILPYAFVSFWITSIAGVLQGSVDGHQRVDLRSACLTGAALSYLAAVFVLVPERGLIGLAQAQVIQAGLLLIAVWFVAYRLMPELPLLPIVWRWDVFKEILSYSVQFQVVSVFQLLTEPITKYLVMAFGGAALAGYFEFAYRMVVQLRTLVVTTHRSIVPTIADLQERAAEVVRDLYRTSFRLILYLILGGLPLLIALSPWISEVWLGSYEAAFVTFAVVLFVGWFLNMLSNPAYFAYLGIGNLRWVVTGHAVIGILNVTLGIILGRLFGAFGVVGGFTAALLVGSLVTTIAYQRAYRIRFSEVIRRESTALGLTAVAGMVLALFLYDMIKPTLHPLLIAILVAGSYLAVTATPLWLHPVRRQVHGWFARYLFGSKDT